ncbi:MAG: hypothetical protein J2P27_13425, partial [Actinobacteria bacterium]|nr:hypothetical protein [Actinomycetota bacterium]
MARLATDRYVDISLGTVDALAAGLGAPPGAVLLATHLKVTSVMTGEDSVLVTIQRDGELFGREAVVADGSWRDLIRIAARTEDQAAPGTAPWVVLDLDNAVLRCRADPAEAERLAGYHRAALEMIAADAGAGHSARSLVSAKEWDLQINRMAGPERALPEESVSELFERQVRTRPDEV